MIVFHCVEKKGGEIDEPVRRHQGAAGVNGGEPSSSESDPD